MVLPLLQSNGGHLIVVLPISTPSLYGSQQVTRGACSKLGLPHPRDVVQSTVLGHHQHLLHFIRGEQLFDLRQGQEEILLEVDQGQLEEPGLGHSAGPGHVEVHRNPSKCQQVVQGVIIVAPAELLPLLSLPRPLQDQSCNGFSH